MRKSITLTTALAGILASGVFAAPSASVNPFLGKDFYVSLNYTGYVAGSIEALYKEGKYTLAEKALKVATVSTFIWLDSDAAVPVIHTYLEEAKLIQAVTGKPQIVQLVVYNIPDRDCSASSSAGQLIIADGGEQQYYAYIDSIVAQIKMVPGVQVAIELEPDAVGNMVTNLSVPKCGNAAAVYGRCLAYAIAALSKLSEVAIYVDAAHDGWLGWNPPPAAAYLSGLLKNATAINPKAKVRGVGTNVSNYNGLGNQPQQGGDELVYARNLGPLLIAGGFPANFIVDQGRSGNQNLTRSGTDWCNAKFAGFGTRPTTSTPATGVTGVNIDAIVWVKPGGESDGTSDPTAPRFDPACISPTSLEPAPQAGTWFEAEFESLLVQSNPPF